MTKPSAIIPTAVTGPAESLDNALIFPRVGEWYWVNQTTKDETYEPLKRWLGCVVEVGSNYAKLEGPAQTKPPKPKPEAEFKNLRPEHKTKVKYEPHSDYYYKQTFEERVHADDFDTMLTLEPNAREYLNGRVNEHREAASKHLLAVNELTRKLGVGQGQLGAQSVDPGQTTAALVLASSAQPVADYQSALAKATSHTIPAHFQQIAHHNASMAMWMKAELISLKAGMAEMAPYIEAIESRVFNVELYAGLVEQVVKVRDGQPAAITTPITLMQRRAYMDEECLADYDAGGMTYTKVEQFDAWIARPHNMQRLLPFERCVLAFQVRRDKADRSSDLDTAMNLMEFISIAMERGNEEKADRQTFLYLRNGEQLYRLSTKLDFGSQLFPDRKLSHLTGKLFGKKIDGDWTIITEGDLEQRKTAHAKAEAATAARTKRFRHKLAVWKWTKVRPWQRTKDAKQLEAAKAKWVAWRRSGAFNSYHFNLPPKQQALRDLIDTLEKSEELYLGKRPQEERDPDYESRHFDDNRRIDGWEEFTDNSVYFDDIKASLKRQLDQHNRLVLVLQGLLDRSETFLPHPVWQLWTEAGFNAALVLNYDSSRALVNDEKLPDVEGFAAHLRQKIRVGTVTYGQQNLYRTACAARYNERNQGKRGFVGKKMHLPPGDPGPGRLAYVHGVKGTRVTFSWLKERQRGEPGNRGWHARQNMENPFVRVTWTCDIAQLFNCSDYTPSGYKPFFADPRSRAKYLSWAPMMLSAEDFHAGKLKPRAPSETEAAAKRANYDSENDVNLRDY